MEESTYKPIFNSEADFQQLWKNPNPQIKCFKEAIDDIYSDSFVFRSFRNEYETDNLFSKHSVDLLKKGSINFNSLENEVVEPSTSVYIPGYKIQSFLPSCSELTKPEMTQCFHMYEDICKNKNLSPEKLAIYNKYRDIIQKEQRLYQDICKSAWYGINYQRTNEIKDEVKNYTTQLWKKRVERVTWYPKHYSKLSDISLIDDSEKKSELIFSKKLKCLGFARFCWFPSLKKNRLNIFNNSLVPDNVEESEENIGQGLKYYKSVHSFLTQKGYHPDVSKDKVAEFLAVQNKASVVMSASSFLCLLDNHSEAGARSWELPIVIKENEEGGSRHKVVYIDKVFPPKSLTAVQRIKWYCKNKIYKLLEHQKKRSLNESENISYHDINNSDDETTYNISKLENFGIENDNHHQSEKKKQKRIETKNSDSGNHDEFSPSKCDSSLDKSMSFDNEDELDVLSDSDNDGLVIDIDEQCKDEKVEESNNDEQGECKESNKIDNDKQNECKEGNLIGIDEQENDKFITEKKDSTNSTDLSPGKPIKCNERLTEKITYNLWSLKSETSNVLLKSNLKDLDIIIRSKERGRFVGPQRYTISSKLEYQSEFGAEVTTHSEITRDWANTLIRPDYMLLRVRLDPLSGDLIMYEKKSLHDLTVDFQRQFSNTPYNKVTSLHALLGQLSDFPPGNYLLSHSPENGSFALLFREEKSRHTYNSYLGYLNIDFDSVATAKGMWLQIDQMVLTPTCAYFNRIPATFHPKITKCTSKLSYVISPEQVKKRKEKAAQNQKKKRYHKQKNRKKRKLAAKANIESNVENSGDAD